MPPSTSTRSPLSEQLSTPPPTKPKWKARLASHWATTVRVVRRHVYFLGPGIVASVAYADPGNWATDLQAGSEYGYSLLFIVLLTGIFAVFIQILSARVGVVTNADLARQCRMLILKEDRHGSPTQRTVSHPKLRRWALLYPLYVIAEGAIVATELAELTGSAIALNLLFPALPLWAGILITSVDVILILFLYKPPPNGSFRLLEGLIAILVFTVLSCFIVLLVRIKPYWPDVFHGYLPSHHVVQSGALYVSVGILGATVMPHAIILGSHFASIDRLPSLDAAPCTTNPTTDHDTLREAAQQDQSRWEIISSSFSRLLRPKPETKAEVVRLSRVIRSLISLRTGTQDVDSESIRQSRRARFTPDDLPPRTLENIRIHLKHASVDIGMSLVSFAIVINSAILIVAAAAFYYTESGAGGSGQVVVASLYDAFYLLKDRLGSLAAILFAVALLAAGQSASITVTLAGQLVSEGFINWRTDPFLRRIVTRLVAIVPSLTVSLAVGKDGLDEMLVASQVALSIALPFVLLPLIIVTGSKARMTAEEMDRAEVESSASSIRSSIQAERTSGEAAVRSPPRLEDMSDTDGITHRPTFTRDASTCASLALVEMLPRNHTQPDSSAPSDEPSKKSPPEENQQQQQQQLSQSQQSPLAASSPSGGERQVGKKSQCFASAWYVQVVAYAIFAVIVVADVYVLITTFMGID
ncbi:related to vacuolar transport protein ESP1 [Ustilago trichophora]|uniref:Related to vacuolar transport protein ESP1 n=1 Tax=Ustilago trichophora TaxID=86804 RepID=A0A5C3EEQ5_9BASI|nr:related to vacuolar transport protein ESP1 [Ustilago trichophora]